MPIPLVYVTGSSHSGSTLMALLADQHPAVVSVGETATKPRIRREGRAATVVCSCGMGLPQCHFWRSLFARVAAQGLRLDGTQWGNDYRFEHPLLDALLTRETSHRPLRRVRAWAARRLPVLRARTRRIDRTNVAFVEAALEVTGARVFCDCTKLPTRLTYLLGVPDFDVRVVWLTRDARGYAWSAKRRGQSVKKAARVWYQDQRTVRRLLDSTRIRHVHLRYEDLCRDPQAALVPFWRLCGVLPVPIPRSFTPVQSHVLGNSMRSRRRIDIRLDAGWGEGLSPEEQALVLTESREMQHELGYSH